MPALVSRLCDPVIYNPKEKNNKIFLCFYTGDCNTRLQTLYMRAPLVPDARFQPALMMRCPATTVAMRAVLVSG